MRGAVIAIRKEHSRQILAGGEDGTRTVALAGNPNVGKSTVFNSLTGLRQHTGNWPGKTVEYAKGRFTTERREYELVDLPGTYSLSAQSPEEEIAREFICSKYADAVIVVCDATCLERNLNLVLQIMELEHRVILCLNLMDEARRKRIWIHQERLSLELGIPVVGINARDKKSLARLKEVLDQVADGELCPKPVLPLWKELLGKESISEEELSQARVRYGEEIFRETVVCGKTNPHKWDRILDRCLTSRLVGYPMMILLLAAVFWITIAGANIPSQLLSSYLMKVQDWLTKVFLAWGAPGWLHGILVLGMYRVLAWVVSVMLPPMAIFFPLFTLLEDAGCLPRIAFNLDHCFQKCKACGKQALTMAMGFGCNTVGVMGCRIIDSPRERMIAILTNSFVPCNGRFPTLILMISLFFVGGGKGLLESAAGAFLFAMVVLFGIGMTFLASALLSHTVLKGTPSGFLLELPPYRRPQVGKVILRSILDRTLFVLGRAVIVAAPAGALIWVMANVTVGGDTILNVCTAWMDPFARLLGLDGVILMAFILGIPANEIVLPIMIMAYMQQGQLVEAAQVWELKELLLAQGWTPVTALCVMVFSLMHWPCSTTLLTIRKETGSIRWMILAFIVPTVLGMLCCALIHGMFVILL
ncbi:MAG: ferrous iron transporter B [Lachnospiraceae bacterium]|nr:ferrous iron transporter B [Lachnospiraceae bacterium]